ncbi:beta-galactosidase family protein [Streptomyces griseoviridis]|uniref:Beta-galactosidase n=3 Tax=Streptomyces TaxID=1883 RepID=A0A918LHH3_STRGD|nr:MULTISPECIES: beta-galactosidase family protein [Streptomyces]MDP9680077.1 beta-galactosidase [Streptomyces griseoviridis]GGS47296.1 beta-galactosidase [Streptomyces niveoruber]GGT05304.1 beta-galactosidase [Streptomyces griseoviridis]GGU66081.1 beta-galactosidase [Streptomyces daghestanicus]GHI29409.1 beta-galactosidase [Streptomyces daghestanicus]
MPALTTTSDGFLLHGEPFRIVSGALHYFRVHPEQWADRLRKARLMGLNTVETYVPWNLHQPDPGGPLDLGGILDLPRFLRLAGEEGLTVLLRPGPYICAEWDGGGLPAWLTADRDVRPRSGDPRFTGAVDRYLDLLLPPLLPYLAASGGPVIAVQVENEYGAYGDDTAYLEHLAEGLRARGVEELLFTCDQADPAHLAAGSLPGVLATGTFGSRIEESLGTLRAHRPRGPLMCAEFWIGWFDHWGGPHHTRDAADAAADLDRLLAAGASVNLYMFHGGTNFGLTNGANHHHAYAPTVTSYDYDAPLTEAGDPGPKYHAFREVIARHAPVPDEPVPPPGRKLAPTGVELDRRVPLLPYAGGAGAAAYGADPLPMRELGRAGGLVLYRTTVPAAGDGLLRFAGGVGDRAQVFVDGAPAGVLERERNEETLAVRVPRPGAALDVLVEDLGGVNYGPRVGDPKGLLGPVSLNGTALRGWECRPLPPGVPDAAAFEPSGTGPAAVPAYHRGTFEVAEPADAFLALPGWSKGLAWVNGFALGRYWNRGPQRTLYVPAPVLRPGSNELVVLELHGTPAARAALTDTPDLGPERV